MRLQEGEVFGAVLQNPCKAGKRRKHVKFNHAKTVSHIILPWMIIPG